MTKHHANTTAHAARTGLCLLALSLGVGLTAGCRGDRTDKPPRQFFPDMDDQPKLLPQSESAFFPDGRSDRPAVPRTVPFGAGSHDPELLENAEWAAHFRAQRDRLLRSDPTYAFGLVAGSSQDDPRYVAYMPVEVNRELIIRGRERFDIYCSACHGYTGIGGQGDGAGTVGKLWSYAPANLLADAYRDRGDELGTDGYLFHVTRHGLKNPDGTYRMPGYAHAVDELDAWAIVAYIRTLQASQGVPASELDPADRDRLGSRGGNQ
ncbi:MAG: cytochrome c [Phycisphaerales bacterium]|nr:cytochrome c [Planctomycetota bacterium]MCH8507479.1 cytochrome c [Phycisphaerales bacterium]